MSTSINHDFTQISCLRQSNGTLLVFYQNTASLVMIGTYTLTDKKWNLEPLKGPASMNVEVARGGAIVSTLLNTDSDPLKESYALFYQNPQLQVVCLQYVPGAVPTWESTGGESIDGGYKTHELRVAQTQCPQYLTPDCRHHKHA